MEEKSPPYPTSENGHQPTMTDKPPMMYPAASGYPPVSQPPGNPGMIMGAGASYPAASYPPGQQGAQYNPNNQTNVVIVQPPPYAPDETVPGCCCVMPGAAKVAAIIDIVFGVLGILSSFGVIAQGNAAGGAYILNGVITIIVCVFVMKGAAARDRSKFLPYLIWRGISLGLCVLGLILWAVLGIWLFNQQYDSADQDVKNMFYGIYAAVIIILLIGLLIGGICFHLVLSSYRYLGRRVREGRN